MRPDGVNLSVNPRRVVEGGHQVAVETKYRLESPHCPRAQATLWRPDDVLVAAPGLPEPDASDSRGVALVVPGAS